MTEVIFLKISLLIMILFVFAAIWQGGRAIKEAEEETERYIDIYEAALEREYEEQDRKSRIIELCEMQIDIKDKIAFKNDAIIEAQEIQLSLNKIKA